MNPWTRIGALVLIWVVVDGACAMGQTWADPLIPQRMHDFGPVPRGAKVQHDFGLTNRLAAPISITSLRASCGCTSGKADRSLVGPGESATITAIMDTRSFVGPKSTTLFVTVATTSGETAEIRLGVTSNILADTVLNPGTIEFGTISRGQRVERQLTIDHVGQPGWRITKMTSTNPALDGGLHETTRSADSVTYLLKLALKPDAPVGPIREEIIIQTNDPTHVRIPVLVSGTVRGQLTASPAVLSLGNVTSSDGVKGRVVLRSSTPFMITKIEGQGDGFRVRPDTDSPRNVHLVEISYDPAANSEAGDLKRVFKVSTDLPGEPPVELTTTLHVVH